MGRAEMRKVLLGTSYVKAHAGESASDLQGTETISLRATTQCGDD